MGLIFLWNTFVLIVIFDSAYMHPSTVADHVYEDTFLCYDGWKRYDQLCFKFFQSDLNWFDADWKCKTMDGYLASIHSKEQNDFLGQLAIGSNVVSYWVGLFFQERNSTFVWKDETDIDYTNWREGEPEQYSTSYKCVAVYTYKNSVFRVARWSANLCNVTRPYVCQKKMQTLQHLEDHIIDHHREDADIYRFPKTDVDDVSVKGNSSSEEDWKRYVSTSSIASTDNHSKTVSTSSTASTDNHSKTVQLLQYLKELEDDYSRFLGAADSLTSSIASTDNHSKTGSTSSIASTDNHIKTGLTSSIASTDNHSKTGSTSSIAGTDNHIKTVATTAITRPITDSNTSLISVTAYVITIIMAIVFISFVRGIFYYKQKWLKEKRFKVSRVFFSRAERVTDPLTELILEPKGKI